MNSNSLDDNTRQKRVLSLELQEPPKNISIDEPTHILTTDRGIGTENEIEKRITEKLTFEIESQYKKMYAEKIEALDDLQNSLLSQRESLVSLLLDLENKYVEITSSKNTELSSYVIEVVFESLFKIIGDPVHYEKLVERTVFESLASIDTGLKLSGKISKDDYELISQSPQFSKIKEFLRPDKDLSRGQLLLDDGISLYEAGLLDRLDKLRTVFLDLAGYGNA